MDTCTSLPCSPSACDPRRLDRWLEDSAVCCLVSMFDPDSVEGPHDFGYRGTCSAVEPHAPVKNTYNRCDDDMVNALESWSVHDDDVPGFLECKAELELMLELETANPEPPPWMTVEELLSDLRRRVAHMRAVERSALAYRFTLR